MAMVDVLDGRLTGNQLHSCKEGRDWRLVDGLAATLRSGELYVEFNGKTISGAGYDKVKWNRNDWDRKQYNTIKSNTI